MVGPAATTRTSGYALATTCAGPALEVTDFRGFYDRGFYDRGFYDRGFYDIVSPPPGIRPPPWAAREAMVASGQAA